MDFTPADLAHIEATTDRALRAVAQFANNEDRQTFEQALFILGEVRHAADVLCDSAAPVEATTLALDLLRDMFRRVRPRQPNLRTVKRA